MWSAKWWPFCWEGDELNMNYVMTRGGGSSSYFHRLHSNMMISPFNLNIQVHVYETRKYKYISKQKVI